MTIAHIAIAKGVCIGIGVAAAAAFAIDPTYKMFAITAVIASIPPTITGIFNNRLAAKNQALNSGKLHEIKTIATETKVQTDGILGRMSAKVDRAEAKVDQQADELKAATTRADSAEGREVGVKAEQKRTEGTIPVI